MDIQVSAQSVRAVLETAQQREGNAQDAFAVLCVCAAALARDIGGLTKEQFLDNCSVSWDGTPEGLLEPDAPKAFDA